MSAYYNENDEFAAAWLRRLILAGEIADGELDGRSIEDVHPDDLRGFTQCHFFAGIGGWSLALRLAGWRDDRRVWTGSCPCQPFSAAGAGSGFADERHLWPAWLHLIAACRPERIFGEQVEDAIGHGWLDLVCDDLEGEDYTVRAVGLPAACQGAPQARHRLWFMAHAHGEGRGQLGIIATSDGNTPCGPDVDGGREAITMADATRQRSGSGQADVRRQARGDDQRSAVWAGDTASGGLRIDGRAPVDAGHADESSTARWAGDPERARLQEREHVRGVRPGPARTSPREVAVGASAVADAECDSGRTDVEIGRPTRGTTDRWVSPWADLEWLDCRDGKRRPTQPGLFPLADGVPGRVGRLRGYGNTIVPAVAAEFIRACLDEDA